MMVCERVGIDLEIIPSWVVSQSNYDFVPTKGQSLFYYLQTASGSIEYIIIGRIS